MLRGQETTIYWHYERSLISQFIIWQKAVGQRGLRAKALTRANRSSCTVICELQNVRRSNDMSWVTEGVARTGFDPCRKIKQYATRGAAVGQRGFRAEALTLGY